MHLNGGKQFKKKCHLKEKNTLAGNWQIDRTLMILKKLTAGVHPFPRPGAI